MGTKEFFKTAGKGVVGVGKKIFSNLSVDGGIEGLSGKSFQRMTENIKTAANIAAKGPAIDGIDDVIKQRIAQMDILKNSVDFGTMSAREALTAAYKTGGYGKLSGAMAFGGNAKSYFTEGTTAQKVTRGVAAVTAYAGVNVAGRAINGGSLTRNNKGERDIAGIPMF